MSGLTVIGALPFYVHQRHDIHTFRYKCLYKYLKSCGQNVLSHVDHVTHIVRAGFYIRILAI